MNRMDSHFHGNDRWGNGNDRKDKKGEEVCGKEKTGLMNQAPTGGTGDGSLFLL